MTVSLRRKEPPSFGSRPKPRASWRILVSPEGGETSLPPSQQVLLATKHTPHTFGSPCIAGLYTSHIPYGGPCQPHLSSLNTSSTTSVDLRGSLAPEDVAKVKEKVSV